MQKTFQFFAWSLTKRCAHALATESTINVIRIEKKTTGGLYAKNTLLLEKKQLWSHFIDILI